MSDRQTTVLHDGRFAGVFKVCCRAPRTPCGRAEWTSVPQIIVPLRGTFVVERQHGAVVADANSVVMLGGGDEYRVGHPTNGGDDCVVLVFDRALLDEALGDAPASAGVAPPTAQLGVRLLTRALEHANTDHSEAEEGALLVLAELAPALRPAESAHSTDRRGIRRRRVEEVRALLASAPTARWRLDAVARAVQCSPFHLARQFRAETGETIGRYLTRLRLALALERLAAGEADLARLARELGFAHHSHLSARFRSAFGVPPAVARDTLTRGRVAQLRKIVTAPRRSGL